MTWKQPPELPQQTPMLNAIAIQVYYDLIIEALRTAEVPRAKRIDELAGVMCVASALFLLHAEPSSEAKQAFLKLMEIFYERTLADMKKQGLIKEA